MNKLKGIVVDDDLICIKTLEKLCESIDDVVIVKSFTEPDSALNFALENVVDFVFLDIHMPGVSGLDFVNYFEENGIPVILTTADLQLGSEAFDLGVTDYVVKPLSNDRLQRALDRARKKVPFLDELNPENEDDDTGNVVYLFNKSS